MRIKILSLILILTVLLSGCGTAAAPTEAPAETTVPTESVPPEELEALRVSEAVKAVRNENSFTFLAFADPDDDGMELAEQAAAMIQEQAAMDFTVLLDAAATEDSFQDLEDSKTRVIRLNTSGEGLSHQQLLWFAEALDLSEKADAGEWGILILSHMPLDFGGLPDTAGQVLDAYLAGTTVELTLEEQPIQYSFENKNSAEIIANVHGYTRNFLADNLYLTNPKRGMYRSPIVRIAIPNAGAEDTNRFGTNGTTDSNGIEFGEVQTYDKVPGTEKATAFNVVTVDRAKKVITCTNYGAGYDREIPYGGLLSELPASGSPAPAGEYTNQVPISTEFGRRNNTIFNEVGYRNHTYLVCNDIDEEGWPYGNDAEYVTTGAIPFTVPSYLTPPVIYIWGAELDEADHTRFFIYDSQKFRLVLQATGSEFKNYFTIEELGEQYYKLTPIPEGKASVLFPATNGRAGRGSIAFSLKGTGENLVITVGEPILPE